MRVFDRAQASVSQAPVGTTLTGTFAQRCQISMSLDLRVHEGRRAPLSWLRRKFVWTGIQLGGQGLTSYIMRMTRPTILAMAAAKSIHVLTDRPTV